VISATENSNKFPKNQVLEGKIVENIWANGTGPTCQCENGEKGSLLLLEVML
jgi:hypothetical protein